MEDRKIVTVSINEMIPLKSTVVKDIILPEEYAGDLDLVKDFEEYLE